MQFQTPHVKHEKYDKDGKLTEFGKSLVTVNNKPTMTKQNLKNEMDVNNIIKKYNKTGVLPDLHKLEAMYGEITSMDLQEAMNMHIAAEKAFMEVPSEIRKQFGNDAGAFIDYATDEANITQMREWGLAQPEPPVVETEPVQVEVVNTPETA